MDCFLIGSRGMDFHPLADDQVQLVQGLLVQALMRHPAGQGDALLRRALAQARAASA